MSISILVPVGVTPISPASLRDETALVRVLVALVIVPDVDVGFLESNKSPSP